MSTPKIVSIQTGPRQEFFSEDASGAGSKKWVSAIVKSQVAGPVVVDFLSIRGDEQADLEHHGGPDKAVLGYSAGHYEAWAVDLPELQFPFGGFGENLTIEGVDESTCCVGDIYDVGTCRLQISQPRQPCWKLSRRWNCPDLANRVQRTGRTGWYFRVLAVGEIEAGEEMRLIERPFPDFTVAWSSGVMHARPHRRELDLELAECPALSESWQTTLRRRASH